MRLRFSRCAQRIRLGFRCCALELIRTERNQADNVCNCVVKALWLPNAIFGGSWSGFTLAPLLACKRPGDWASRFYLSVRRLSCSGTPSLSTDSTNWRPARSLTGRWPPRRTARATGPLRSRCGGARSTTKVRWRRETGRKAWRMAN